MLKHTVIKISAIITLLTSVFAGDSDQNKWFHHPGSSSAFRSILNTNITKLTDSIEPAKLTTKAKVELRQSAERQKVLMELYFTGFEAFHHDRMTFSLLQTSADSKKECRFYLTKTLNVTNNYSEQQSAEPNIQQNFVRDAENFVHNALSQHKIESLGNLSYCLNTESLGNLYNLNYVFYLIFSAQTANSDIANFFCTFFRYAQGLSSEIFLESSQWNKALKLLDESFDSAQSGLKKDLTSDDLFMFRKRVRDAIEKLELEKFRLETTPESTDINSSCFTDGMMFASCGRKFFEGTKNLSKEEFLAKLRTETLIRPRLVALTNDETIARTTLELDYFLEFTTSLQSLLDAGT